MNVEATRIQGQFVRHVIKINPDNFRIFGPDETNSNRWNAVFEVTNRCSTAQILAGDDHVAPDGRVMEMLSEHQCEGWLEGLSIQGLFSLWQSIGQLRFGHSVENRIAIVSSLFVVFDDLSQSP